MTRIGFITTLEYVPTGGSEDLWAQTALRMAGEFAVGANVQRWDPVPKHVQTLIDAGCAVHQRFTDHRLSSRIWNRIRYGRNPLVSFYRWFDTFAPDFVLISQGYFGDGLQWMEQCVLRNIRFAVVSHLASEHFWQNDDITNRLIRVLTQAERFYFVSKANRELTERQLACRLPNAEIVKNPVKLPSSERIDSPAMTGAVKLAFVGRYDPFSKGLDLLFQVLSQEKWKSRDIEFHFFGDGVNAQTTQRLAQMCELNNVHFRGYQCVDSIWAECHALILPSRMEGLALVMIEAMVRGRPVIATNVGGCGEIISDNIEGFVAANATVQDIDEALERAWSQRHRWVEVGDNARARALAFIPPDPIAEFVERLRQLL
jgi:glycosyltransferase involved in cell wall biosynthesis